MSGSHYLNRRQLLISLVSVGPTVQFSSVASAQSRKPGAPSTLNTPLRFNVRDFGARGDGATKDTAAFQQALDRCAALGGGEVIVPAGNYRTGAIALRSNTLLRLEKDAVIAGSGDFADYPVTQVRWEGKWIQGRVGLIYGIDANQIGIAGPGKIIGNSAVAEDLQRKIRFAIPR